MARQWDNGEWLSRKFELSALDGKKLCALRVVAVHLELDKLVDRHPGVLFIIGQDILQKCERVIDFASKTLHAGQTCVESKTGRSGVPHLCLTGVRAWANDR